MRGGGPGLVLLVVATIALAGCGMFLGGMGTGPQSLGCADMSSGACQEMAERVAARHPGATGVELTCTVPVCDRNSGAGTAIVTMPDGSRVNDTFAYTGVQGVVPAPVCKGLAFDVCRNAADDQIDSVAPSRRIIAIEVTCTSLACTAAKGETKVTLTFADGSREEVGMGWEGALR